MAMSRWDPFRDLMSIQNELNRLFGRTYAGGEGGTDSGMTAASWVPAIDVFETPEKIVVKLELAGIDPEDVDVSVEDSTLTVTGERRFSSEVSEESYHRVERRYGRFARSIGLPQTANVEAVEATFDKGVLTIEVPKAEEAKPRKISIKATG